MSIKETTVERMVLINAPPEVVWHALEAKGLSTLHLMREEGEPHLKEGGRFQWHDLEENQDDAPRIKGRIAVIAPPRRIAFMAFMPSTGLADVPENYTLVDIQVREHDKARTLVTVSHGDFATHPHGTRLARQAGDSWVEALIRLKHYAEREAAA